MVARRSRRPDEGRLRPVYCIFKSAVNGTYPDAVNAVLPCKREIHFPN